jgi:hypothetical protein
MMQYKASMMFLMILLSGCSATQFKTTQPSEEDADQPDVLRAIDPECANGATKSTETVFPPFLNLVDPVLPSDCTAGFEMNNLRQSSIVVQSASGSRSIDLAIDIATYRAPDDIRVVAVNGSGQQKLLLHTCRMQTWDQSDPTDGSYRPVDETIRQFHVRLPAGTKSLHVDNSLASTPTYIRIKGLCDFSLSSPSQNLGARWRVVN